ncbi:MAG: hypothetical protein H6828_13750 [Planctomycetes bacterium]|nr:hypothetical protein [Planctomycetota bacterium]
MNRLSRLLFVVALGVVLALVAMVSRQRLRSPHEVLEEVRQELAQDAYDEARVLRQLGGAIRRAETMDPDLAVVQDLCSELRLLRARVLMEIGANTEAREDLEQVLFRYRPADADVRRLLVAVDRAEGDLEGALRRLSEILEQEPDYGPAWAETGLIHQLLAQGLLDEAAERMRYVLVSDDVVAARAHLESLAARPAGDPLRTSDLLALRTLFPTREEEVLAQVLELAELAAGDLAEARAAYLRSFQLGLDPAATRGYLEILVAAGRTDDALHLGLVLGKAGEGASDPQAAQLLIEVYGERGDWRHAAELASDWIGRGTPLEASFLRLACEAIYRGARWNHLFGAANRLRSIGSTEDEASASFYSGMAYASSTVPKPELALRDLGNFARGRLPEPFPGAREAAWKRIAELHREAGDLGQEREAINAVLTTYDSQDGELWLRRAEIQLQTRHSGYALPLESWTRAMSLLPRRTTELWPTFEELGEKALAAQDRDVEMIYRDLENRGLTVPQRDYGPYVLLGLARRHGVAGNRAAQAAIARRLLDEYPGFLPALDELIESRKGGYRRDYVELVVQRAELAGLDTHGRELLAGVTREELLPGQVVRLMQVDSQGLGRALVSEWSYERGDVEGALQSLGPPDREGAHRGEQELLLGARIEMERGHPADALTWLAKLPKGGASGVERRRRALTCALELDRAPLVRAALVEVLGLDAPEPGELLALADLCQSRGETQGAAVLLDRVRELGRSAPGAVPLRRALLQLSQGRLEDAAETVDVAEPFLEEVDAAVLRVLLAAEAGDWPAAAAAADRLLELAPPEEPELAALLFLLQGREAETIELADFALELAPESTLWTLAGAAARLRLDEPLALPATLGAAGDAQTGRFLLGAPAAPGDPRLVAAWLLASRRAAFHPYVLDVLERLEPNARGRLWPGLLVADLLEREGRLPEALRRLGDLNERFPDALVVLGAEERVLRARLRSDDHPRVLALRDRRFALEAERAPEGSEAQLLRARTALAEGDLAGAQRRVLLLLGERSDWIPALALHAQVLSAMHDWEPARAAWQLATASDEDVDARRAVAGYVALLDAAAAADALPRAEHLRELEELVQGHPHDPRPVLALARLDLGMDPANPAIGVGRALQRLTSFREAHPGLSLEDLQRGATSEWAEFYVSLDPSAAQDFLRAELELQPGDVGLWRLLGRVQRELGDLQASMRTLALIGQMNSDEGLQLEFARTLVALGYDSRAMRLPLNAVRRRHGGQDTFQTQLLSAQALLVQQQPNVWAAAVELLEPVWARRDGLSADEVVELAESYGRALLLRDEPGDAATAAEALRAGLREAQDTARREMLEVWLGLARARRGPTT